MRLAPLESIQISPNRQRREFDEGALHELAESIQARGLYHPICLRQEGDRLILVSGERRLRAIRDIYGLGGSFSCGGELNELREFVPYKVLSGYVPYNLLGDLSPLEAEEAELEENIRRRDLTWQERAAATSKLARLRAIQAADKGLPPPTTAQIAEEVRGRGEGQYGATTYKEMLVARHLDNPAVREAKSIDEAMKVLIREESAEKNRVLAATVGRTFTAEMHKALNEDSLDWMLKAAGEQFNVILTDPPYGMGADEFGDSGGKAIGAHSYADDEASFTRTLSICQAELFRLAKPEAHLYWFCDIDQFHASREAFNAAGWWVHRTPLVWHKPSASRIPWANPPCGPQRKYELILYAVKGKKMVTGVYPDVISCNPDSNLGHHAQKPVALFADLLRRSVRPGDTVLDPFMGSGPIFPAAHELKCRATGIEQDLAAYGIALTRLEALKAQKELYGLLA